MERNNGYIYGSVAPKFPKEMEIPVEKQRVQRRQALQTTHSRPAIPKARLVFSIIVIVAISFLILYRFSVLADLNYQMGKLNNQYNQLREENRMLEVDIAKSINLDNIKKLAEEKFNMHKPERYQTVLVSVPKNNYSVVMDQTYINETTKNASLVENIINAIKAIFP